MRKFSVLIVILIMFLPGCGSQSGGNSDGRRNDSIFASIFSNGNSNDQSDQDTSAPAVPGDSGGDEGSGGDTGSGGDEGGSGDEDSGDDSPLAPLTPDDEGGDEDSGDDSPLAPLFPGDDGNRKEQDIKTEVAPRFWDDRIRYKFPLKLAGDWDIGTYGQGVGMDGFVIMASSEDPNGAVEFLRDQITAYKDNGIVMKILSEDSGDGYYYFEAKMVGFGLVVSVSPDGLSDDICSIVLRENYMALDNNEYKEALEGKKN